MGDHRSLAKNPWIDLKSYPSLYDKIDVTGYEGTQGESITGFAYKMNYKGFHTPSPIYVRGIRNGLKGVWDKFYHNRH